MSTLEATHETAVHAISIMLVLLTQVRSSHPTSLGAAAYDWRNKMLNAPTTALRTQAEIKLLDIIQAKYKCSPEIASDVITRLTTLFNIPPF